ncbi:CPBP family intramembrane metalloprotease [Caldibacillus lycopersici]|uniref:CPBP family intramembrane metalloprotease n=1 Tax=Perspicuibacillus lycopersici TaxID=1325689 RepID=A0AAE3ISU9_9BACI|nr:type II CAAX endopeptidase family protein [Perspicuibacillus lycopersici]MCU9613777.1 CPBP family intramembrane metalloprotease [Perspicuibacillus lycopersici]
MRGKHIGQIVLLTILSCIALFIIEQIIEVGYVIKTAAKLVMFLIIPLAYITFVLRQPILAFLNVKSIDIKNLRLGFIFGVLAMGIVISAFVLFHNFINTDTIIDDLQTRLKITPEIFLFIAIYITLGNSLLEEFYFRGFIFFNLYKTDHKLLAYLFSSLLFSVYHVAIFAVWFNIWLILLAMLGLFLVGLVFSWLNTKSNNFLNSWLLHILADLGVMLIGFHLFGFY